MESDLNQEKLFQCCTLTWNVCVTDSRTDRQTDRQIDRQTQVNKIQRATGEDKNIVRKTERGC